MAGQPAPIKVIKKNLEYAVIASFIDFDPSQYPIDQAKAEKALPRVVVVDGQLAVKLKGRIYTKI